MRALFRADGAGPEIMLEAVTEAIRTAAKSIRDKEVGLPPTGIMRHILRLVWRRKRSVKYNCKK